MNPTFRLTFEIQLAGSRIPSDWWRHVIAQAEKMESAGSDGTRGDFMVCRSVELVQ